MHILSIINKLQSSERDFSCLIYLDMFVGLRVSPILWFDFTQDGHAGLDQVFPRAWHQSITFRSVSKYTTPASSPRPPKLAGRQAWARESQESQFREDLASLAGKADAKEVPVSSSKPFASTTKKVVHV